MSTSDRDHRRRGPRPAARATSRALGAALLLVLAASLAAPLAAQEATVDDVTSFFKLKLGGFSDFNYVSTDEEGTDSNSGFEEGQFVLHFNTSLGPKLQVFAELSVTATDSQYRTEVERVHLSYLHSDALKLSGGRFHTPINWWNTAFHHGQWLQTTANRPQMTRFGGVFIPVHFVGALLEGKVPAGGTNLGYAFGVGNGRAANPVRGGDAGDVNNSRAWLLGVSIRPDKVYNLQLGGAYYNDQIRLAGAVADVREDIYSAYVVWLGEEPEVIAEVAHVEHSDGATGAEYSHDAYYVQLAYRLPWAGARVKPYVRWEDLDVEAGDPVFARQPAQTVALVGIRFDFYPSPVALKLEVRQEEEDGRDHVTVAQVQISFAF